MKAPSPSFGLPIRLVLVLALCTCLSFSIIQSHNGTVDMDVTAPIRLSSPATKAYTDDLINELRNEIVMLKQAIPKYSCSEAKQLGIPTGPLKLTATTGELYEVHCDMDSEEGPWMLILNYVHSKANTDSESQSSTSFPTFVERSLGDSSVGQSDWGHVSPSLLSKFSVTTMKFYCVGSQKHTVMNFITSHANSITYATTGSSSFSGIQSSWTPLAGHNATIPADAVSFYNGRASPLTEFPFYKSGYHWGISGGSESRFECDDYLNNGLSDTIHRIWVK